jgi:hypothetical protein
MLIVVSVVWRPPMLWLALPIPLLVLAGFAWALLVTSRTSFVTFGREQVELRGHGFVNHIPFAALEEVRCTDEDVLLVSDELVAQVPYLFRDEAEKRFVAAVVESAAFHHPAGLPSHLLPGPSSGSEAQVDLQASAVTSLAPQSPRARPRRARRRASPVSPLRTALLLAAGLVLLGAASYPTVEAVSFNRRTQVAVGTVTTNLGIRPAPGSAADRGSCSARRSWASSASPSPASPSARRSCPTGRRARRGAAPRARGASAFIDRTPPRC